MGFVRFQILSEFRMLLSTIYCSKTVFKKELNKCNFFKCRSFLYSYWKQMKTYSCTKIWFLDPKKIFILFKFRKISIEVYEPWTPTRFPTWLLVKIFCFTNCGPPSIEAYGVTNCVGVKIRLWCVIAKLTFSRYDFAK